MKINLTITFALILILNAFPITEIFSQNYFIVDGKDSTFCNQINFFDTNAQGKMIDTRRNIMQIPSIKPAPSKRRYRITIKCVHNLGIHPQVYYEVD